MPPYLILRILIENPKNANLNVRWSYSDVVEGGWVKREDIFEALENSDKILIVTEGSSDAFVLGKSLEILAPDIVDFFYFVDMEEHYPFTGSGNLYRFCQGLASINIQNKVLVIYDNDVEGIRKHNLSKQLSLPNNMRVVKLPDHPSFDAFQTIGPNGYSKENINGAAVAIECFLDLVYQVQRDPCIRWTSFDSDIQRYQGELIDKDVYLKKFSRIRTKGCEYDFSKLSYLIDHIYNEWVSNME